MKRSSFAVPAALALATTLALTAVSPSSAGPGAATSEQPTLRADDTSQTFTGKGKSLYIVEFKAAPVAAYRGGIKGYPATRPAPGQKIDVGSAAVSKYVARLERQQTRRLDKVGVSKAVYRYTYAYNGVAARMTATQATKLAESAGVLAVSRNELLTLDTSSTPSFLGLNAQGGIWSQLAGTTDGTPIKGTGPRSTGAGEGVVVGIVDSGFSVGNPSFSDRDANGDLIYKPLKTWKGKCQVGQDFDAEDCNKKVIGARYYTAGWGGDAAMLAQLPYESASPRDIGGHGSHTASTAAGNYGVPVTVDGTSFGAISGMAPRARIAVYKVCYGIGDDGGCQSADSVAAIDQAVADGVDVLNFSISGTRTNFRDPVEIAWLFAADAGVFVAASAGNNGPGASTVAHPSPWVTTVAASTHARDGRGSVTLGNGAVYEGSSLSGVEVTAPLVNSSSIGAAGADATEVNLCYPGTLDPAKASGKIVVCDRGVNARTDKSYAVKQAGGVGMILINPSPNSVNADLHFVPTVHLDAGSRSAVRSYADTTGATATIGKATLIENATAPTMASFSSRGPLLAGNGDLLKPDITAPGVDILAAVAPAGNRGRDFDFYSGTSMSSPHVAGLAALMTQLHPSWSPAAMKSAMMTTAYQTTRTGTSGQVFGAPFDFGAGHVDINPARSPGAVFDAGFNDYLGFLCGTQLPTSFCTSANVPVLDPSDLNVPSIAIGDLAGTQTVTRTLKNVTGQSLTFGAAVTAPAGTSVEVSPASFTVAPGASRKVSITITTTTAAMNAYTHGNIVWTSDKGHRVRIPVVVRPVPLAAPASVTSTGGDTSFPVRFGYNGTFGAAAQGLVPATVDAGTVAQDPDQTFSPTDPTGTAKISITIPAGSTYYRVATFDSDVAAGTDLDLYVYQGTTLVGSSAGGTSQEEVNFTFGSPTGGPITLTAYVHGWGVPAGTSPYKLHTWGVPNTAAGNMAVTPSTTTATIGGSGTVALSFSGLQPATRYLGGVTYSGAAGMPRTIVSVTTP